MSNSRKLAQFPKLDARKTKSRFLYRIRLYLNRERSAWILLWAENSGLAPFG